MDNALVMPSRGSATAAHERAVAHEIASLQPEDTALRALTDFRYDEPLTVEADAAMEDALTAMERSGVHALLVTRDDSNEVEQQVVGLVTHYDIDRRNPHRHPGSASRPRPHLRVSDVMTPWNELSLVHYDSLTDLTAADLFDRFQGTGLTHLLVIEMRPDETAVARGLISRGSLAKWLRRSRRAGRR